MKKISIIVPVYKVEKYLDRCVESIVNQTYKNIEIILIDDGSPDNCPKMCDDWANKDERIKVVHKKNGGLSDARNKGLEVATGDYIGFVDSDDVISEKMYETLLLLIEKYECDISKCDFYRFNEGENPKFSIKEENDIFYSDEILKKILIDKMGNYVCNKLFKKEIFEDISFKNGVAYEDMGIFYKLVLKSSKMAVTKSELYGYMQRKDSITNGCSVKNVRDYMNAINARCNDLADNKELQRYLELSKIIGIYVYHIKAVSTKDKNFFFSNEMLDEYKVLKKLIKFKYLKAYLEDGNLKTKIYKIILLLNRNLFWKLMTRKSII